MNTNTNTLKRIERTGKDLLQTLQDKTEYLGEPGLQFIKASIDEPVKKILHPLDTGSDMMKAVWATILRTTEVTNDGFIYIAKGPQSGIETNLEGRQDKAYSKVINNAVDQAIKRSPSSNQAGPNDHDELQLLSQVGPTLIRQLHAAGIYKFSQIANPTKQEKRALKTFESRGAFTVWKDESQQLISSNNK